MQGGDNEMMKDGTYTMKKEKLSYQDGFQVGLVEGTYALVKNQQEIDGVLFLQLKNLSVLLLIF